MTDEELRAALAAVVTGDLWPNSPDTFVAALVDVARSYAAAELRAAADAMTDNGYPDAARWLIRRG